MKEGRKPECPEKTPGDELQKCHILKPDDSSPKRDSNLHNSIGGRLENCLFVGWLLVCLTSQQHDSVSQVRICSGNFTCCHTEIEATDETFHLTQSQYTDTGPTSPSTDPITPGARQGSHWSANFEVTGMTRSRPGIFRSRGGRLNR